MVRYIRIFLIAGLVTLLYSCATPSSPTGGPPDKTGPKIVKATPSTGTVNYKGDKVELHFSEYVKRNTLSKALQIEPSTGIKHHLDWGKKSVAIKFNRSLPDSTTLIITVGTDFSDLHGNTMDKPYKIAFSTGPSIDKGQLVGQVIDAQTGKTSKGKRVLLYRKPVDLSKPANYIAETDTSGVVNFSYLSPGSYKAFWVNDVNRDKIWEPKQERAQPFNKEFDSLKKAGKDTLGTLYIAKSDTTKPKLQGVGLFSSQRLRLRFSEDINLTDSTHFSLQDSSTGQKFAGVYPLYTLPKEKYVLFAQSTKPLSPDSTFKLSIKNIVDNAGNVQPATEKYFTGSSQKDTTRQRLVGTSVGTGIFPTDPVEVAYAKPITNAVIRDSLSVTDGDSVYTHWSHLSIQHNKVKVMPDSAWKKDKDYAFNFWNPITQKHHTVKPTIWHQSDLGALKISFKDSTGKAAGRPTQLLLKTEQGKTVADTSFTEKITIHNLAPDKHLLIIYQDLNKNGKWDAGSVAPFKAPEPYFVKNNIMVQKGTTTPLSVSFNTFNIPNKKPKKGSQKGPNSMPGQAPRENSNLGPNNHLK
ncbi:MAG TPA: Ig-like domain-containing protein [Balneolaceae bacterium]|nr:Ig-like domain-containing protein [Balneolaceae bacterium]